MAFLLYTLLSIVCRIGTAQVKASVSIGRGTTCAGVSDTVNDNGVTNIQIQYDLNELYQPKGVLIPDKGLGPTKSLRLSICGSMTPEETSCGQNGDEWCFEEVNKNGSCIAGIANWHDDTVTGSQIEYVAMFSDKPISKDNMIGIRVTVSDYGQYNMSCPNAHSTVNYKILCATDTNWTHVSFKEERSECVWNVTLRSQYGCFTMTDVGFTLLPTNLSAGSVFLVILMVVLCTYCILGCAYNSFYHGRLGMDAVPNRDKWLQFARYTSAGCAVTKDSICGDKSDRYEQM